MISLLNKGLFCSTYSSLFLFSSNSLGLRFFTAFSYVHWSIVKTFKLYQHRNIWYVATNNMNASDFLVSSSKLLSTHSQSVWKNAKSSMNCTVNSFHLNKNSLLIAMHLHILKYKLVRVSYFHLNTSFVSFNMWHIKNNLLWFFIILLWVTL